MKHSNHDQSPVQQGADQQRKTEKEQQGRNIRSNSQAQPGGGKTEHSRTQGEENRNKDKHTNGK